MTKHMPLKAYKNQDFLNSPAARHIRILCEYEETRQRFMHHGVRNTLVFFGSARTMSSEDARNRLAGVQELLKRHPDDPTHLEQLEQAEISVRASVYYDAARELARRLTAWSMERKGKRGYYITSGAGPGIMEAANRGAADVPGGRTVGLGISLPFEEGVNDWVTPDLAFEFHYFFTRKLWFMYLCKGLVVFPGGFGTMDEMFEALTLIQTRKVSVRLPIVLFGDEYWDSVINMDAMAKAGTISPPDKDLVFRTDSVDEAFEHLTAALEVAEEQRESK